MTELGQAPAMREVTSYLAVRPLRALVLVAQYSNVSWQVGVLNALAAQTRFWGGSGNLPIPCTPNFDEKELFWAIATAQDPDALVVHPGTRSEIRPYEPDLYDEFERDLRSKLEALSFSSGVIDSEVDKQQDAFLRAPLIEEPLASELVRRLCLLHHAHRPQAATSTLVGPPGFPFTDSYALDEPPERIASPRVDGTLTHALQIAAEVGMLTPTLEDALTGRGLTIESVPIDSASTPGFVFDIDRHPSAWPVTVSETGLSWFSQSPLPPSRLTLVVGDDPWDFALFYALRRMTGLAYWLPSDYVGNPSALIQLASAIQEIGPEQIAMTSAESAAAIPQAVAALAGISPIHASQAQEVAWSDLIPTHPRRLLAQDKYGVPQSLLLEEGRSGHLATPIPSIRAEAEHETRWMTEVRIDGWQPVQNCHIGPSILEASSYRESVTRATREGAAYFGPHFMWFGGDLEGQTVRPRLHRLELPEQVTAILAKSDWTCTPSDKGIYAQASADLFGGLPDLAEALESGVWIRAFDALTGSDPGKRLKDQRTYLTLDEIVQAMGGHWSEGDVQETTASGLLARGLIHKCTVCRWASWYDQSEIGADLRCGRCRKSVDLGDANWLGHGEPTWHYRLAEVVWQFLDNDGDVPIRGIFKALWEQDHLMFATPELDLWPPGASHPIEIDICVQKDAELWIGEAKVADNLGTKREELHKLSQLKEAADLLGAHGVLFVTAADGFREATSKRIDATFQADSRQHALTVSAAAPAPAA